MNPQQRKQIRLAWIAALAFALGQGLAWWLLMPPWSAPDEPGHFLYAQLLADLGRRPSPSDITAEVEAPILDSLARSGWWRYLGRDRPESLPARFNADPLLAASGAQIDEPPLFYLPAGLWLRRLGASGRQDPAQALRWLRLWSLLLRLSAVGASLILATRVWPERPGRVLGLGLLVGGLPMVGFIGGSFNNASLTLAWGALLFLLLALPDLRGRWLYVGLAVFLGTLFVDRSLIFYAPITLVWALLTEPRTYSWRRPLAGLVLVLLVLAFLPNPRWAAGWRRFPEGIHSRGRLALHLGPATTQPLRLTQFLSDRTVARLSERPLELRAEYWGVGPAPLLLSLADDVHTEKVSCPLTAVPQTCTLAFTPDDQATHLKISAKLSAGAADFRLQLRDAQNHDLLFNGDGRYVDVLASPLLRQLEKNLPVPAGFFAQALAPGAWDALSLLRYFLFAGFTWASFWGYFGWLSHPLPWWCYLLLAALTLGAGWGAFQRILTALRRWRRHALTPSDRLFLLSTLTLVIILIQVWLPMIGQAWQPQGRYLFPALLPIAALLLLGWEQALPARWRTRLPHLLFLGLSAFNLLAFSVVS